MSRTFMSTLLKLKTNTLWIDKQFTCWLSQDLLLGKQARLSDTRWWILLITSLLPSCFKSWLLQWKNFITRLLFACFSLILWHHSVSKLLAVAGLMVTTAKYSNGKLVAILHNLTSVRHHDRKLSRAKSSIGNQNFEQFLSSQPKRQNCMITMWYWPCVRFCYKILVVCVF